MCAIQCNQTKSGALGTFKWPLLVRQAFSFCILFCPFWIELFLQILVSSVCVFVLVFAILAFVACWSYHELPYQQPPSISGPDPKTLSFPFTLLLSYFLSETMSQKPRQEAFHSLCSGCHPLHWNCGTPFFSHLTYLKAQSQLWPKNWNRKSTIDFDLSLLLVPTRRRPGIGDWWRWPVLGCCCRLHPNPIQYIFHGSTMQWPSKQVPTR